MTVPARYLDPLPLLQRAAAKGAPPAVQTKCTQLGSFASLVVQPYPGLVRSGLLETVVRSPAMVLSELACNVPFCFPTIAWGS